MAERIPREASGAQSPGALHVTDAFRQLSVRPVKKPVSRGPNVVFTFWCTDKEAADKARVSLVQLVRERYAALATELEKGSVVAPVATQTDYDAARNEMALVDRAAGLLNRPIRRQPPLEDVSGDAHHLTFTVPSGSQAHSFLETVFNSLKIGAK